jgi:hypothetical protein
VGFLITIPGFRGGIQEACKWWRIDTALPFRKAIINGNRRSEKLGCHKKFYKVKTWAAESILKRTTLKTAARAIANVITRRSSGFSPLLY